MGSRGAFHEPFGRDGSDGAVRGSSDRAFGVTFAVAVLVRLAGKDLLRLRFESAARTYYHDGAAAIVEDGRIVTAAQEAPFGIEKLSVPRSQTPAVTHVDYSTRVQTVHRDTNRSTPGSCATGTSTASGPWSCPTRGFRPFAISWAASRSCRSRMRAV